MINLNDNGSIEMIVQATEDQVMDKSLHHWESELCCEPYRIQGHQPFLDLQPLAATLSEGFFLWKLCSQTSLVVSLMAQWIRILLTVQEMWVQFLSWEDPLEKGMATPSSTLAWEIPWTEESGGLQSMASQELDRTHRLNNKLFNHFGSQPIHA